MLDMIAIEPFNRFIYKKGLTKDSEKIRINGTFKEEGSDKIHSGDNFDGMKIPKLSVQKIYKLYIEWFNLTRRPGEKKRIYVSAKLEDSE